MYMTCSSSHKARDLSVAVGIVCTENSGKPNLQARPSPRWLATRKWTTHQHHLPTANQNDLLSAVMKAKRRAKHRRCRSSSSSSADSTTLNSRSSTTPVVCMLACPPPKRCTANSINEDMATATGMAKSPMHPPPRN